MCGEGKLTSNDGQIKLAIWEKGKLKEQLDMSQYCAIGENILYQEM